MNKQSEISVVCWLQLCLGNHKGDTSYQTLRTLVYKQEVVVLKRWPDGDLIAGVGLAIRSGVMSLEVQWEVSSWVEKKWETALKDAFSACLPLPLLYAPIAVSLTLPQRTKKTLPDSWEYSLESNFFGTVQNTCQQVNNNILCQCEEKPGNFVIKDYFSFSWKQQERAEPQGRYLESKNRTCLSKAIMHTYTKNCIA